MGYIFKTTRWVKQEALTCDHPQVEKIWEWGGMSAIPSGGEMIYHLSILLKNGDKRDFASKHVDEAIGQAEEFLQSL